MATPTTETILGTLMMRTGKHYAPAIFASLRSRVKSNQRNVGFCRTDGVVGISHEFMDPLPTVTDQQDYSDLRSVWHTKARDVLTECDLVFLDPDIGVKDQLPSGPLRASEYSSYSEVCDYDWCDLLVVQFLQPRSRFQQLRTNPVTQHAMRQDKKVVAFIASSLAFLYVTNQVDITLLKRVFERWDTKISPQILIA